MTLPMRRRGGRPARYWDPFSALPGFDDLFDRMNQLLTRAFPDVARISIESWSPPVDIQEADDAFLVEADLPGVPPEAVNVDLEGRELRISGEYGTEAQTGAEGAEQRGREQRRTGQFNYRITLPGEVKSEACEAHLEHGVLRLRLPKATSGARQRIPVRAGGTPSIPGNAGTEGSSETPGTTPM